MVVFKVNGRQILVSDIVKVFFFVWFIVVKFSFRLIRKRKKRRLIFVIDLSIGVFYLGKNSLRNFLFFFNVEGFNNIFFYKNVMINLMLM